MEEGDNGDDEVDYKNAKVEEIEVGAVELKAEGFHFVDSGKVITFSGKAKLVFFPGIGKPSS